MGIQILYKIFIEIKGIRELLTEQRNAQNTLTTEQACIVLNISETNLNKMIKQEQLLPGIHFQQIENTRRFHPNLGHRFITKAKQGKQVKTEKAVNSENKKFKKSPINHDYHVKS